MIRLWNTALALLWSVGRVSAKEILVYRTESLVRFAERPLEWYEGKPMIRCEGISK